MPGDTEGKWRLLNPLAIRFSQPRIAPHFRDGHLLDDTCLQVEERCLEEPGPNFVPKDSAEGVPPYDVVLVPPFPAMRVISWMPKIRRPDGEAERDANGDQILGKRAWFALDNRRLHSLQYAAASRWPRRCCVAVRCIEEVPGGSTMKEIRKFRTTTEGRCVEVGIRVGETETWSWQKAAPAGACTEVDEVEGHYPEDLWDAIHWAPRAVAAASKEADEAPSSRQASPPQHRGPPVATVAGIGRGGGYPQNGGSRGGLLVLCPEMGWQYIDPHGKTQGPFPIAKMRLWYQHGYFLPDLPMRCDEKDAFVPFQLLFPASLGLHPFVGQVMRYSQ